MHVRKNWIAVALVATMATLIPSGANLLAKDDERRVDVDVRNGGNIRIVTTDDRGEALEEIFALHGTGSFLGVRLDSHLHGRDSRDTEGARVERVIGGSPAEDAGLQDGDVIVGFNGYNIEDAHDLTRYLRDTEPGESVDIEVERDGSMRTLRVELGESRSQHSFNFSGLSALRHLEGLEGLKGLKSLEGLKGLEDLEGSISIDMDELSEHLESLGKNFGENFGKGFVFHMDGDDFDSEELNEKLQELGERLGNMDFDFDTDDFHGNWNFSFSGSRPKLGVQLVATTQELREHLGGSEDAGVLVSKVLRDTPAEAAGVQVGDLIMSVDGQSVGSSSELIEALSDRDGDIVELELLREGRTVRVDVELEASRTERIRPSHKQRLRSHYGTTLDSLDSLGSVAQSVEAARSAYGAALKIAEASAVEERLEEALEQYRETQAQVKSQVQTRTIDLSDTY